MKNVLALMAATVLSLAAASPEEARVKLENLRHPELKSMGVQVMVLPIGSTEPHANHLPYCTDALTVDIMAARVAAQANAMGAHVLVLPTMPYGVNSNQVRIPTPSRFARHPW